MSVYEALAALEQQWRETTDIERHQAIHAKGMRERDLLNHGADRFELCADALAAYLPEVRQLEKDLADGVELFRILQRQRDELQEKLDKAELQLRGLTIPMETAKLLGRAEQAEATVRRLEQEQEPLICEICHQPDTEGGAMHVCCHCWNSANNETWQKRALVAEADVLRLRTHATTDRCVRCGNIHADVQPARHREPLPRSGSTRWVQCVVCDRILRANPNQDEPYPANHHLPDGTGWCWGRARVGRFILSPPEAEKA